MDTALARTALAKMPESAEAQGSGERKEIYTPAGTINPTMLDSTPAKSKSQKLSLGEFLGDQSLGSRADEMKDMPVSSDALCEDFASPIASTVLQSKRSSLPKSPQRSVHNYGAGEQKDSQLTKSSQTALPTTRDHITDQLNVVGDAYIELKIDAAGERKVDLTGHLKDGREYQCRTFHVQNRANKLFMLATECARVLRYRYSYQLFNENRSLYKIIANQNEKDDLIAQEVLPWSCRSRQIPIVTARSVFRQFGSRVVVNGLPVRDDYWPRERKSGFTEAVEAGQERPGGGKGHLDGTGSSSINPDYGREPGSALGQGLKITWPSAAPQYNVSHVPFDTSFYTYGGRSEEMRIRLKLESQGQAHENFQHDRPTLKNLPHGYRTSRSRFSSPEEGKEQDLYSSSARISSGSTVSDSVSVVTRKRNQSDEHDTWKEYGEIDIGAYSQSQKESGFTRMPETISLLAKYRRGSLSIAESAGNSDKAIALFDFAGENDSELPLSKGQALIVPYQEGEDWLFVHDSMNRESGLVPEDCVRLLKGSNVEGQGELRKDYSESTSNPSRFQQSPSRPPPQQLNEAESCSRGPSARSDASNQLYQSQSQSRPIKEAVSYAFDKSDIAHKVDPDLVAKITEKVINSLKASGFNSASQSHQKLHQPPLQQSQRPNRRQVIEPYFLSSTNTSTSLQYAPSSFHRPDHTSSFGSDSTESPVEEPQGKEDLGSRPREKTSSPPFNINGASYQKTPFAPHRSSISQEEEKREDAAEDRQPDEWTPKGVIGKDALQLINSVATQSSESASDSDTGSGLESWWDWDFPRSALADMKAQTIAILIARFSLDYSSYGDFFASIRSCHEHAAGPQTNEPGSFTGSGHPSNATGRQCGKRKRKGLHDENCDEQDKDEEDDKDGDEQRRKRSFGVRTETDDEERLLACPFYKKDPIRHRACARKVLKAVPRVKYHLLRCHQQPIHCDRCSKTFNCENDRVAHARMTVPCTVRSAIKWDAINDEQKKQLSRRISSKQSERDQWFGIYAILFPDAENVPASPYLDRLESRLLRQLVTYAEVEGKGIVDELMVNLPENLWLVEVDIAAFLESATQDFISRLFEKWEDAARTTLSKGSDTRASLIPPEGPSVAAATATATNGFEVHPDTHPIDTTQSLPLQPVTTVPATAVAPHLLNFREPPGLVNSDVQWSGSIARNDYHVHAGPSNCEQWALNNTSQLGSSHFANLDLLPNTTSVWPELLSMAEPSSAYQYNRVAAGKASQE